MARHADNAIAIALYETYSRDMSAVEELETAVKQLSPEDRALFRAWYIEFEAQEWDRQMEADAEAGRLDWLVAEARHDRKQGRCTNR